MSNHIAYRIIQSALQNPSYLQNLQSNPDLVIRNEGITDQFEAEQLKQIITFTIAGANQSVAINQHNMAQMQKTQDLLQKQIETTLETADAFKKGLRDTVSQIEKGFQTTMAMYTIAFLLGVGLIIASVAFAFTAGSSLLPIVFGTLGTADIIAYFITKPPQDLQKSRADLAQLQAAFFNWFCDSYNWNAYLGELGRRGNVTFEDIREVSDTVLNNTSRTMELIEKYCCFSKLPQKRYPTIQEKAFAGGDAS